MLARRLLRAGLHERAHEPGSCAPDISYCAHLRCRYLDDKIRICRGGGSGTPFVFRMDTCADGGELAEASRQYERVLTRAPAGKRPLVTALLCLTAVIWRAGGGVCRPLAIATAIAAMGVFQSTGGIVLDKRPSPLTRTDADAPSSEGGGTLVKGDGTPAVERKDPSTTRATSRARAPSVSTQESRVRTRKAKGQSSSEPSRARDESSSPLYERARREAELQRAQNRAARGSLGGPPRRSARIERLDELRCEGEDAVARRARLQAEVSSQFERAQRTRRYEKLRQEGQQVVAARVARGEQLQQCLAVLHARSPQSQSTEVLATTAVQLAAATADAMDATRSERTVKEVDVAGTEEKIEPGAMGDNTVQHSGTPEAPEPLKAVREARLNFDHLIDHMPPPEGYTWGGTW